MWLAKMDDFPLLIRSFKTFAFLLHVAGIDIITENSVSKFVFTVAWNLKLYIYIEIKFVDYLNMS